MNISNKVVVLLLLCLFVLLNLAVFQQLLQRNEFIKHLRKDNEEPGISISDRLASNMLLVSDAEAFQKKATCKLYEDTREPLLRFGKTKVNPFMAIAIPSVMRSGKQYLFDTLSSMIKPLSEFQRKNTVIYVYVAESNVTYVEEQAVMLQKLFGDEILNGLLVLISSPREIHPHWESKLVSNFGDSVERTKWRSKQNLDMEFLMSYIIRYADPKYFLMMEDDVTASPNYMSEIVKFAESEPAASWEYCIFTKQARGAGNLFHYKSTREFATFLGLFWDSKPLDWLFTDFIRNKRCGYSDSGKECQEKSNKLARLYPDNLFTHNGKVSSRTRFGIPS